MRSKSPNSTSPHDGDIRAEIKSEVSVLRTELRQMVHEAIEATVRASYPTLAPPRPRGRQ